VDAVHLYCGESRAMGEGETREVEGSEPLTTKGGELQVGESRAVAGGEDRRVEGGSLSGLCGWWSGRCKPTRRGRWTAANH
jgi:hypothetical protein